MYKFVLCFFVLIIGFSIGMCIGTIYELVPAKAELTIAELTSLFFTILGGAGGIVGSVIALYAWGKWKSQYRKTQHYEAKVNILRLLSVLDLQAANMVTMRANPSDFAFDASKAAIIKTLGELSTEFILIKSISMHLSSKEKLDMDELKKLPEISADILNLKLWPHNMFDTVDYLSISSRTNWRYERAKEWFYSLPNTPKGEGLRDIKVSTINTELEKLLEESTKKLIQSL
ncbi:hypothetical protein [Photobacterium phosphoreum]|uniref:hypothetical protein n=1 Tax=Photobacterium phosphoreum TaxID=659 RepID=UPI001E32636B|nr:hypothetical protein [Photobacterium phosphoreum]MCD9481590.1 hypothetical protein [Photobacterium phosphoreum]